MAYVSVTRLRLRSVRFLPSFILQTIATNRQLRIAEGMRSGWVGNEGLLAFWTATVWDTTEAMRRFRDTGAHLTAMRKLLTWCDEASFAHWEEDSAQAPDPATAYARMAAAGKVSKVLRPSAAHSRGRTVGDVPPRPARRFGR